MIDTLKVVFNAECDTKCFEKNTIIREYQDKKIETVKYFRNDLKLNVDYNPTEKTTCIHGSIRKALRGTNLGNDMLKHDELSELYMNILSECGLVSINKNNPYYFTRIDIGLNHKIEGDCRFLIGQFQNASRLKNVNYGNETFFLKNSQRQFRIYDKISELIEIAKQAQKKRNIPLYNSIAHMIGWNQIDNVKDFDNEEKKLNYMRLTKLEMKNEIYKSEKEIIHNVIREEISIFKKRNIERPGLGTFNNICCEDRLNNYLSTWKKKLGVPEDITKSSKIDLKHQFLSTGIDGLISFFGASGLKKIGYKRLCDLFRVCDVPRATRFRYQKKIKDLIVSTY